MKQENKWQRIRYMPATPLGRNGHRVTGSRQHINLSRRAATEGMVLLKNQGGLLPLAKGTHLALFGKGCVDYVKGGGGSGDVTTAYTLNLVQGLEHMQQQGKVALYAPLVEYYQAYMQEQYAQGCEVGRCPEAPVAPEMIAAARAFADTAVISICRFSGEGWDRTGTPYDGDFYLSRQEEAMVNAVKAAFPKVVVVLNTGGMMDTAWFKDDPQIQAALLGWQAGMEGALATAEILVGDVCPSGRLVDTFAKDFAAYPSSDTFHASQDYVTYNEDIYVGYRYFETIPSAAEKVCYPFGYGLSYTDFAIRANACMKKGRILVEAEVTNTGTVSGKQVVQVYCQAPQGLLGKPRRVLVAFAKTKLLEPGASQLLQMDIEPYTFASYDDTGAVCCSAWVLEKGTYSFFVGSSVRDGQVLPFTYTLEENQVLQQLTPRCQPRQMDWRLQADGSRAPVKNMPPLPRPEPSGEPVLQPVEMKFNAMDTPQAPHSLDDVAQGTITLDEFMESLTIEQMVYLLGGQPNRGVANTCGVGGLRSHGIPCAMTADGPAGVRINKECGVNTTAFPCATLLACTWNEHLVSQVGQAAGLEAKENGFGSWLAPAMNIHRNPLCGRNFEYYAEDPLVAGRMATAMVRGVESQGVATSIKHFACNNKEINRQESDSRLTERALREIYLKGFEIAVKQAQPMTLMSSYNLINGVRASENYDLLTGILRQEWGYKGLVTTDWWANSVQYREIAAGNDVKMPRGMPEHTLRMLQEGKLNPDCVRTSARRLLEMLLRLD